MKFRYYCLVVMGKVEGVKDEIQAISESQARYMDAKGILVATFKCAMEPSELQEYFKLHNRSFLIFDTDSECAGFYIDNKRIDTILFDYIRQDRGDLEADSTKLVEQAKDDSSGFTFTKKTKVKKEQNFEFSVEGLGKIERQEMMNNIIDKGIENFTAKDRKILEILSKTDK